MGNLFKTEKIGEFLASFAILVFLTAALQAQTPAGGLRGRVTDQLGGVVINTSVAAVDESGANQKTVTDKNGAYVFNSLKPGRYTLQIDAKGFAVYENANVEIVSGRVRELDIQLEIKVVSEQVTVDPEASVNSDPNRNVDTIVLRDKDLDILPEDPAALAAALQAMAGPSAGPQGPQVYVDGFTNAPLPPKQTIREVRVSQNTFTAENDRLGSSRIDILTKPGTDQFHGGFFFNLSSERLNARNPFAGERAPYKYRQYGGNLSGPVLPKRLSYFLNFQYVDERENGIVSARVIDNSFNVLPLNLSFGVPRRTISFNPRLDYQINANHTLIGRYSYARTNVSNLGVGELSLPERSYERLNTDQTLQLTETAVINPQTVNETRFQFVREERRQEDTNTAPGIIVQDSFFGGGSGIGSAFNKIDRYELQNYTTTTTTNHVIRFGVRLRGVRLVNSSPANFNGTFVFSGGEAPLLNPNNEIILDGSGQPVLTQINSLERYRRTLLLQQSGLSPAAIRLRGGGASQFLIARGDPEAKVSQLDFGGFVQDEWRLRQNLNLYLGVRYEAQTNINDNLNFAPRISFAWAPGAAKQQKTTIRGGFGIFYERFGENYTLQALRYNGVRQQRFTITDPGVLNLFPNIPTADALASFTTKQTVTRIDDQLRAARISVFLLSFEHKFPRNITVYASASKYRSRHTLRQRNINAPLPDTFVFGQPESGIRPFGNVGEIFLIESTNDYNNNQLVVGARIQPKPAVSLFLNYYLTDTKDGGDYNGFPADSYNLQTEWGRSGGDIRHRFYMGGTIEIPKVKVMLNPLVIFFSERPFNITTGVDTNGDQVFTERPSLAGATANVSDIRQTPFGNFNVNPAAGEAIIPRNFGKGPSFFSVNLGLSKTIAFGTTGASGAAAQNSSDKPYKMTFSVQIQNFLNRTNLATPIGNLNSPFFGQSIRTTGAYGFDYGGPVSTQSYNRRIEAQIRFSF
jgi:hypothetical protein